MKLFFTLLFVYLIQQVCGYTLVAQLSAERAIFTNGTRNTSPTTLKNGVSGSPLGDFDVLGQFQATDDPITASFNYTQDPTSPQRGFRSQPFSSSIFSSGYAVAFTQNVTGSYKVGPIFTLGDGLPYLEGCETHLFIVKSDGVDVYISVRVYFLPSKTTVCWTNVLEYNSQVSAGVVFKIDVVKNQLKIEQLDEVGMLYANVRVDWPETVQFSFFPATKLSTPCTKCYKTCFSADDCYTSYQVPVTDISVYNNNFADVEIPYIAPRMLRPAQITTTSTTVMEVHSNTINISSIVYPTIDGSQYKVRVVGINADFNTCFELKIDGNVYTSGNVDVINPIVTINAKSDFVTCRSMKPTFDVQATNAEREFWVQNSISLAMLDYSPAVSQNERRVIIGKSNSIMLPRLTGSHANSDVAVSGYKITALPASSELSIFKVVSTSPILVLSSALTSAQLPYALSPTDQIAIQHTPLVREKAPSSPAVAGALYSNNTFSFTIIANNTRESPNYEYVIEVQPWGKLDGVTTTPSIIYPNKTNAITIATAEENPSSYNQGNSEVDNSSSSSSSSESNNEEGGVQVQSFKSSRAMAALAVNTYGLIITSIPTNGELYTEDINAVTRPITPADLPMAVSLDKLSYRGYDGVISTYSTIRYDTFSYFLFDTTNNVALSPIVPYNVQFGRVNSAPVLNGPNTITTDLIKVPVPLNLTSSDFDEDPIDLFNYDIIVYSPSFSLQFGFNSTMKAIVANEVVTPNSYAIRTTGVHLHAVLQNLQATVLMSDPSDPVTVSVTEITPYMGSATGSYSLNVAYEAHPAPPVTSRPKNNFFDSIIMTLLLYAGIPLLALIILLILCCKCKIYRLLCCYKKKEKASSEALTTDQVLAICDKTMNSVAMMSTKHLPPIDADVMKDEKEIRILQKIELQTRIASMMAETQEFGDDDLRADTEDEEDVMRLQLKYNALNIQKSNASFGSFSGSPLRPGRMTPTSSGHFNHRANLSMNAQLSALNAQREDDMLMLTHEPMTPVRSTGSIFGPQGADPLTPRHSRARKLDFGGPPSDEETPEVIIDINADRDCTTPFPILSMSANPIRNYSGAMSFSAPNSPCVPQRPNRDASRSIDVRSRPLRPSFTEQVRQDAQQPTTPTSALSQPRNVFSLNLNFADAVLEESDEERLEAGRTEAFSGTGYTLGNDNLSNNGGGAGNTYNNNGNQPHLASYNEADADIRIPMDDLERTALERELTPEEMAVLQERMVLLERQINAKRNRIARVQGDQFADVHDPSCKDNEPRLS